MLPFVTAPQIAVQIRKVKLQIAPSLIAAISLISAHAKNQSVKTENQITQPSPSPRLSNTRSFSAAHDCKETSSSAAAHPQLPALRRESREPLSQALYPASDIILCSIQPTTNSAVNSPSSPAASTV